MVSEFSEYSENSDWVSSAVGVKTKCGDVML